MSLCREEMLLCHCWRMMAPGTFFDVTGQAPGLIEAALEGLERGGNEGELANLQSVLRQLLIDLMHLLERDPGIEAAAADLYDATSVLIRDTAAGSQRSSRTLRVFRDSRARFRDRLVAARPSEQGSGIVWRHRELLCA